ncbi:hypothetical protein C2845_PM09G04690 [Panicum miliaceum]|uniref:Hydroxyproline O-arabinosyltransferase-like domain-containing protein n=1 Tax=Panicum miliaceum TaxID=4540 RepID=A0A3L6RZF7_PANMI|nr:hypothetical protein C2845_PM09G04690 [Panicum miliaceum]
MAAPCGRGALPVVLVAISAALLTYNALLSSSSGLLPLTSSSPTATASSSSSRRFGAAGSAGRPRPFHTAVTASGSAYNTWQCRVMYHWFKEARRVLWPWAFVQWLQKADIKEEYILMAEPDHIIVKPIPNLSRDGLAAAFPFFYIEPEKNEKVLRKLFPEDKGPITKIDPIGNSPVIIEKESLARIAPTWMNISIAMKKDPDTDKIFGWILEMYGYAVASAIHGVGNILRKDFMIQPPWDLEVGDAFIIHYTYGCDYDKEVTLVKMVNEATASIPNWDSYAAD